MENWSGLLALFEKHLAPFSPAPKTSHDKQECIAVQHFIYILFVLFESIQEGESKIVSKEDNTTELVYEGESYVIAPTRNFMLYINDLFGIKNISLPKLSDEDITLTTTLISQINSETPLNEMELHIEQWISEHIDDEWNIYIELAENGDLSVETVSHMQRIQKRLAVLGQKTFRRHHVASQETAGTEEQHEQPQRRKIYLQKQTRKIKRAVSD